MPGPKATSPACPAAHSSLGSWAQCPHLSTPPPALPWPWWTPDAPPKGAPCPVPSPGLRPGSPGPRSDYSPPPPFSSTHNSPHCCHRKVIWPLEAASQADSPALGPGGEQLSPGKTAGPILGPYRGNGEGVMDGEQGLKELGVSVLEERRLAA